MTEIMDIMLVSNRNFFLNTATHRHSEEGESWRLDTTDRNLKAFRSRERLLSDSCRISSVVKVASLLLVEKMAIDVCKCGEFHQIHRQHQVQP